MKLSKIEAPEKTDKNQAIMMEINQMTYCPYIIDLERLIINLSISMLINHYSQIMLGVSFSFFKYLYELSFFAHV